MKFVVMTTNKLRTIIAIFFTLGMLQMKASDCCNENKINN